jgi:sodium transport system ATP-binding protein
MIAVRNLRKAYGRVPALHDLSFDAADGRITTILGGNGSGKTTTLRSIAGMIRPDAGTVRIDGLDPARQRVGALERLGVIPEEFGLYPRMTAREHLEFFGQLHGLSGSELRRAVDTTIDRLDMSSFANRRAAGLSQGQRVKVALGRAIVPNPRNVVMDEPTRGLDIFAVRLLRATLRELRESGTCIVLSSHVMADVQELSDEIVLLAGGRAVATGSPEHLLMRSGTRDLEAAFFTLLTRRGAA